MTEKFEKAVKVILEHEGGYVFHPADPGGETNMGISKRSYPDLDIKNLTVAMAKEIYFKDFWKKLMCEEIKDDYIALHLFDFAVNTGRGRAVKKLQSLLNTKVDGIMGPHTLSCINRAAKSALGIQYRRERIKYYSNLAKRHPELNVFLNGWIKRVYTCVYD